MDCNKEEAARAKQLAEEKMSAGDFVGAHRFLTIAQRLFPNLGSLSQMIATCDVHSSADQKINGLDDWYGVLQVQPFADAATIKKQYRKLVRLLHPDKNKFAGGEAAFKLVGEANRLLSDQIKRSQYNIRYRSHSMFARKQSNSDTGRHCSAASKAAENIASGYTFWTRCKNCGQRYKYLKRYMNKVMHCSFCLKSYVACNIGCGGVPPRSSTAGVKQFQDQERCNPFRQNAFTGAESVSSAAEMDKNETVGGKINKKNQENQNRGAGDSKPKKDESCTENEAAGEKPQKGETVTDTSAETSASKSMPDLSAPKKNQAAKKRRKAIRESCRRFEVDGSDVAGAKTDTSGYNKRKLSMKKPQVSYAEGKSDGDFVSPPRKKTKSGCEFESNPNTKQTAADNKSPELVDSGVSPASSHANKAKANKKANSGNEDILSAKDKESEGCGGNAAPSSKIDKVESGYKATENPNALDAGFKQSNADTGRHCSAAKNIASGHTFWTRCKNCGQRYKYLKRDMNKVMNCSMCLNSYVACNIGCDGVPPSSSTAGVKQFQDQEMSNTCGQNPFTGTQSGSSAAEMDKNETVGGKINKKNQESQNRGAGDRKPKKDESCTEDDAAREKPEKGFLETSASKSMLDLSAPKKNQAAKKRSKAIRESSKSFEVDGSDVAGAKTDTNGYNKRKLSRKKSQVSYAAGKSDGDFVSSPTKKKKSGCEFESNGKLEIVNVFEAQRKTENFAVNQVWSICDPRDGMPRKYARVKKVLDAGFKLRITCLEPVQEKNDETIPVACGVFKNGETKEVEDRSIFSGQMLTLPGNRVVFIYPRKGEIWAMFRDWNEEWNTTLENHKLPYKYDLVEIVNNFSPEHGIGVAYLGKIKGFVSLYHWEAQHGINLIQLSPGEILRFSHKVPAVKMTGKEKECVPADSYELDPTALAKDIFQVDPVNMEMDSETLKGKADGPYLKSFTEVEAMKNIQRELELKKQLRQTRTVLVKHEAPTNYTSQQNATETEAVIRDALMDHGNSTLLERHKVASVLRGSLNPGDFILELVQGEIRAEVDLQESLVENWVLLFEELVKVQREDEPELRPKATQVAILWKSKITGEAPKSSLEALTFLMFIVAYGLEELINQEETALLASSVAQYEHAPILFDSLKLDIPEIVEYLITKRHYIPAVRLICPFKLDKDFPASHLLTKEIMDLRRSALERRPAESSQAKDKDAARLRAVLELVVDYKLEMNLPGDLIAKLMIQRENSTPPVVHCSARHHTSTSNPQANSPNLASAQLSSVNLKVPKPEVVIPT